MNIPSWWPHGVDEQNPDLEARVRALETKAKILEARVKALETKVDGMYESMIDWVGRTKALETQLLWEKSVKRVKAKKVRDTIRRGRR